MNIEDIKQLAQIVSENGLESLEVISKDATIKLKNRQNTQVKNVEQESAPQKEKTTVETDNKIIIKSPMVGVFYSSPSPDSDPFVKVGDKVKKGDVLCIIEAMKLLNDITADRDGEIAEICVEDGQAVEFAQPLFKLV
jgi:acetyl-CoA carboxylase biotin carboxyl carrier protein